MNRNDGRPPPTPRTLVLGGAGFIGRHAVAALLDRRVPVVVGSRHPGRAGRRLPVDARSCPRVAVHFENTLSAEQWAATLSGIDVVVNCVGILRPRGRETYERVHHLAPAALAEACRQRGIRLIHISALGLDGPCRSGFLRSKQGGEAAIRSSGVHGAIVRPSLLDAPAGGYGARWIRRAARLPFLALPADATGRIAALDVRDLGDALATLVIEPGEATLREYEFGGLEAVALREYLAALRRRLGLAPARVVTLPSWLARALAHACDVLHATPYSFGHWELLRRDNCPRENLLPAVLHRIPRTPGEMPSPALPPAGVNVRPA